jgi:hypothetical protein
MARSPYGTKTLLLDGIWAIRISDPVSRMNRISDDSKCSLNEVEGMNLFLSRMYVCRREDVCKKVLSGVIANTYRLVFLILIKVEMRGFALKLRNVPSTSACNQAHVLNLSNVPSKSGSCVNVVLTHAINVGRTKLSVIYTILEAKHEVSNSMLLALCGVNI